LGAYTQAGEGLKPFLSFFLINFFLGVKMQTIQHYSKIDIEKIIDRKLRKNLDLIYDKLDKLRNKLIDIEKIIK